MKVIKATGLVPVKALKQVGGWGAGQVFGVMPKQARLGLAEGSVELYPIPADVETYDIDDPAQPAPAVTPSAPVIQIPEDWSTMHHLKRFALAKKIGDIPADQRINDDEAIAIIQAEVEKRRAATA